MKKLFSLLLAFAMAAVLLTGCGGEQPIDDNSSVSEVVSSETESGPEEDPSQIKPLPPVIGETESVPLDAEHFPSEDLRAVLSELGDEDGDGVLSAEERYSYEVLLLQDRTCKTLKGIEYLPELKVLTCFGNELEELDLSHNPELRILNCFDNHLTELDVSHNPELTWLNFYNNEVSTIDLSNNIYLTGLYCQNNKLTALDVSHNTELEEMAIEGNPLSQIDLTNNNNLKMNEVSTGDIPVIGR